MDQVQNSILQVMQAVAAKPQASGRSGTGRDEFRKLMEGQRRPDGSPAQAESGTKGEAAQDGEVQEVLEEDAQLQERMALAAAAMLQTSVVTQVQENVETVEVQPEAAVEAVEVMAEAPVETAVQAAPEETVAEAAESVAGKELPKVSPDGATVVRETPVETRESVEAPQTAAEKPVEETEVSVEVRDGGEEEQKENLEDAGETAVFQDLKAVPVKVGETQAPEKPQEAKPVEAQIGEKLTEALKSGETRVEIQLTPENLGKVTIEVTAQQDGSLRVSLHAELSQTRELLARDLGTLQSALARNTQQEVRVEVQRQEQERNFYEDGRQGHERQNPQQQKERQSRENTEDFLHQLRLGLIPEEGE